VEAAALGPDHHQVLVDGPGRLPGPRASEARWRRIMTPPPMASSKVAALATGPPGRSEGSPIHSPQHLVDGDQVHQPVAVVERGDHLLRRVAAAQLGHLLGAGPVGGQVHPPQQRVTPPGAGELVGPLAEQRKSRRSVAATRPAASPGARSATTTGSWRRPAAAPAASRAAGRRRELLHLGHAVGHEDGVVGDSLRERRARACSW